MADDVAMEIERIGGKRYHGGKVDYFLNELHPGKNANVPDPWYGEEDGYIEVYAMIEQACDAIIKNYLAQNSTTQSHE